MINGHKAEGEWNIQLKILFNFLSFKDSSDTVYSKSDIGIMAGNETNEIIEECFDSLLQKYQLFLIALIYCITNFIK